MARTGLLSFPCFGNALKELIGDSEWQALMPFALGYPTVKALASPRRAVEDVLLQGAREPVK